MSLTIIRVFFIFAKFILFYQHMTTSGTKAELKSCVLAAEEQIN
jgi:hypothetical protein